MKVTGVSSAGEVFLSEAVASQLSGDVITEPVGVRMLRAPDGRCGCTGSSGETNAEILSAMWLFSTRRPHD